MKPCPLCPPFFPSGMDFDNRCPIAASVLGVLQPKEKLCEAPLHLPSSVACCYGNSRLWNGLSLEKKGPPLSALFLWPVAPLSSAKDPLSTKKTVPARRACRLPGSSPNWKDWYTVACWWRALQYLAMSGLSVQISLNWAYLSSYISQILPWDGKKQTALRSTSTVKSQLCPSRIPLWI